MAAKKSARKTAAPARASRSRPKIKIDDGQPEVTVELVRLPEGATQQLLGLLSSLAPRQQLLAESAMSAVNVSAALNDAGRALPSTNAPAPLDAAHLRLENAIDAILGRCSQLHKKIEPVLTPEGIGESAATPGGVPAPLRSTLTDRLHEASYRLERLATHLDTLIDRVEL